MSTPTPPVRTVQYTTPAGYKFTLQVFSVDGVLQCAAVCTQTSVNGVRVQGSSVTHQMAAGTSVDKAVASMQAYLDEQDINIVRPVGV